MQRMTNNLMTSTR